MRGIKVYSIVTQFLVQTFVLVLLGMYIGQKLDSENNLLQGILGVVGGLLGIAWFIVTVLKMGEKDGRKPKD